MSTAPVLGNRTCPRYQVLNSRVQLKLSGIFGRFGKELHQLSLINLSTAGIQAVATKRINQQKEYDIALLVPAFPGPISAKGRVVWHKPYTADNQREYFRVGIEFTYFKGDAMRQIESLVANRELREMSQS